MDSLLRRDFLGLTAGAAAAAALPRAAFGQGQPGFAVRALADDVLLVTGAAANVVVAVEPDGLVVIDGGAQETGPALRDFILRETGASRIKTLFNTHWHPQQTGLNAVVGAEDGRIVAHENTKLWLGIDIEAADHTPIHTALPQRALPNDTFYDVWSAPFADGEVRADYVLQAHTDGDILISFPARNIIVAGGVLKTDGWAEIDAWTGGWIGTGPARALNNVLIPTYGGMVGGLQKIAELADDATVLVPADGPATNKVEVQSQIQMYAGIADKLREGMYQGLGPDEVVALQPAAGQRSEWGSPDAFLVQAFKSMWPHLTPDA